MGFVKAEIIAKLEFYQWGEIDGGRNNEKAEQIF